MMTRPFTVDADHPALAGHFPGRPIVPGATILSEVIRCATALGHPVAGIPHAKFAAPLLPGEDCSITIEPGRPGQLRFQVAGRQGVLVSGSLAVASTDPP